MTCQTAEVDLQVLKNTFISDGEAYILEIVESILTNDPSPSNSMVDRYPEYFRLTVEGVVAGSGIDLEVMGCADSLIGLLVEGLLAFESNVRNHSFSFSNDRAGAWQVDIYVEDFVAIVGSVVYEIFLKIPEILDKVASWAAYSGEAHSIDTDIDDVRSVSFLPFGNNSLNANDFISYLLSSDHATQTDVLNLALAFFSEEDRAAFLNTITSCEYRSSWDSISPEIRQRLGLPNEFQLFWMDSDCSLNYVGFTDFLSGLSSSDQLYFINMLTERQRSELVDTLRQEELPERLLYLDTTVRQSLGLPTNDDLFEDLIGEFEEAPSNIQKDLAKSFLDAWDKYNELSMIRELESLIDEMPTTVLGVAAPLMKNIYKDLHAALLNRVLLYDNLQHVIEEYEAAEWQIVWDIMMEPAVYWLEFMDEESRKLLEIAIQEQSPDAFMTAYLEGIAIASSSTSVPLPSESLNEVVSYQAAESRLNTFRGVEPGPSFWDNFNSPEALWDTATSLATWETARETAIFVGSIVNEPFDWVVTGYSVGRDIYTGNVDFWTGLEIGFAILPLVPGAAARGGRAAIDTTRWVGNRSLDLARWTGNAFVDGLHRYDEYAAWWNAWRRQVVLSNGVALPRIKQWLTDPNTAPIQAYGNTLFLGEGSLGFSRDVIDLYSSQGRILVSTIYESSEELLRRPDLLVGNTNIFAHNRQIIGNRASIIDRVDARNLIGSVDRFPTGAAPFDTVVFHFPHRGGARHLSANLNREMLDEFFASASDPRILNENGIIVVALSDNRIYNTWSIQRRAESGPFVPFGTRYSTDPNFPVRRNISIDDYNPNWESPNIVYGSNYGESGFYPHWVHMVTNEGDKANITGVNVRIFVRPE